MYLKLFTFLPLAQNRNVDQWVQVLVVVIMAAFWALSGLVNAKKQSKGKRSQSNKPLSKPGPVRFVSSKPQYPQKSNPRDVQPVHKPDHARPAKVPVSRRPKAKPVQIPSQPKYASLPKVKDDLHRGIIIEPFSTLLLDYHDCVELRRAVIASEVLGKPLALREPVASSL